MSSDDMRPVLEAIRDQARLLKDHATQGVELANNREQHIFWSATAIEADALLRGLDTVLEP